MDFEEEWRQAQADSKNSNNNNNDDDFDDFDDDLLQSLPCAHDVLPEASPFPFSPTGAGEEGQAGTTLGTLDIFNHVNIINNNNNTNNQYGNPLKANQSGVFHTSALWGEGDDGVMMPTDPFADHDDDENVVHMEEDNHNGVCVFPPLDRTSFMLCGDKGVVRWVTASAMDHSTRKRRRVENAVVVVDDDKENSIAKDNADSSAVWSDDDDDEDANAPSMTHLAMTSFNNRGTGRLLSGAPIEALLAEVHTANTKEAEARQQRDADELLAAELGLTGHASLDEQQRLSPAKKKQQQQQTKHNSSKDENNSLWVMKYTPRHFRDLLSDDNINLQLLQWIKSWDSYVFQGDAKEEAKRSSNNAAKKNASGGDDKLGGDAAVDTAAASAGPSPPEQRMAILTGPPGVGKTTLVHVLAMHCGYEVIEINASVERTTSRLENIIKTAVSSPGPAAHRVRHMQPDGSATTAAAGSSSSHASVTVEGGRGGIITIADSAAAAPTSLVDHLLRPKCLIIDEMDGIAANVAQLLMKLDIHRPVFCLCNDFYVPSLRVLRQQCQFVFHLPAIRPQRLLSRLEEICSKEGLVVDQPALAELVRSSNGDIRSCLNTLQFLSSARHHAEELSSLTTGGGGASRKESTVDIIRRMQGKDSRTDVWTCWQAVFNKVERAKAIQRLKGETSIDYESFVEASTHSALAARRKRERERVIGNMPASVHEGGVTAASVGTVTIGFKVDPGYIYAAHVLRSNGSGDGGGGAFLDGIQENYLRRPYADYSFSQTSCAAETLSHQNVLHSAAFTHTQSLIGFVNRYESAVTAPMLYACCSSLSSRGERLSFPSHVAKLKTALAESAHAAQSFREGCSPSSAAHMTSEELIAGDIAPLLVRSLFDANLKIPSHAITSLSSLSPNDQRYIQASVERHVAYGLHYRRVVTTNTSASYSWNNRDGNTTHTTYCLTPAVDKLGGWQRGFSLEGQTHYNNNNYNNRTSTWNNNNGNSADRPSRILSTPSSAATAHATRPSPPLRHIKEDVKELLVSEIQRYTILQRANRGGGADAAATKSNDANAKKGGGDAAASASINGSVAADTKKNNNNAAAAPALSSANANASETVAATSGAPAAPVKKDFFGRIIRPKPSTTTTTTTAAGGSSSTTTATTTAAKKQTPPPQPAVRYVYHDGSTNAVKMPATYTDF